MLSSMSSRQTKQDDGIGHGSDRDEGLDHGRGTVHGCGIELGDEADCRRGRELGEGVDQGEG